MSVSFSLHAFIDALSDTFLPPDALVPRAHDNRTTGPGPRESRSKVYPQVPHMEHRPRVSESRRANASKQQFESEEVSLSSSLSDLVLCWWPDRGGRWGTRAPTFACKGEGNVQVRALSCRFALPLSSAEYRGIPSVVSERYALRPGGGSGPPTPPTGSAVVTSPGSNRYPIPGSVKKNRGRAGSGSSFRRIWAM